jgi:hypothetical protein
MAEKKMSLGQAIDTIIEALELLDPTTRQTAITAACSHLNIEFSEKEEKVAITGENPMGQTTNTPIVNSHKQIDIRALKEEKAPKSAAQMACVVAFYLQELAPINERKKTINAGDLDKYFKQAKFPLPKAIPQLLKDARIAGYFDSAPGKGEYSLNAVGYNLVAHKLSSKSTK